MLFRNQDELATLRRALRAAVAAHRRDIVRELAAHQGGERVAQALAGCSRRVRDDALSMLAPVQRLAACRSLEPVTVRWRRSLARTAAGVRRRPLRSCARALLFWRDGR